METKTIKQAWEELKIQEPQLRIRNAAEKLGVSEVELLATQIGNGVIRLKNEFQSILAEVEKLGYVMALTRNESVVHERKGHYLNPELNNPHVGLFVGEDIDLRIFFACWGSAFAVTETSNDKPRKSIQFFAKDGEAIHKIYLNNKSNQAVYDEIIEKFISENQQDFEVVQASELKNDFVEDKDVDVEKFQQEWRELKDTHHFFGMLKKHKLSRTQALRLAPEGNFAIKVDNNAFRKAIELAVLKNVAIMIFVGNRGMIQIHTGEVHKLVDHGDWFNILDPEFNLHLKESNIQETWIVRKPTDDGLVTALELFDKNGEHILQLFGKRKPGIPELSSWREIVEMVELFNK